MPILARSHLELLESAEKSFPSLLLPYQYPWHLHVTLLLPVMRIIVPEVDVLDLSVRATAFPSARSPA